MTERLNYESSQVKPHSEPLSKDRTSSALVTRMTTGINKLFQTISRTADHLMPYIDQVFNLPKNMSEKETEKYLKDISEFNRLRFL